MTELRAFIIETAKEAGKIMLEAVDIKKKQQEKSGDYNPVTAYDVAVQNFLFSALKKRLPEAKFIGEEVGTDTPTPPPSTARPTSSRTTATAAPPSRF